jgi:hypothetical protein
MILELLFVFLFAWCATSLTTMTDHLFEGALLSIFYYFIVAIKGKEVPIINTHHIPSSSCDCDLKGFHQVGFCASCVKQTRLPMHCDGCGGHSRANIKQHVIENGQTDYICTKCFHLARYSHHCDTCGGRTTIVEIH